MRKFFFLFLLLAAPLAAQNPTAVSGTIIDPNGVAYYPATVTACLTPVTLDPIVNGQHVNQQVGRNYCAPLANTTQTGFFSLSLFPNSSITPGGTQWQFTVTALGTAPPAGKGSQTFQVNIAISGTSQDVGAILTAASLALLNTVSPNSPIPANLAQGPTYNILNYAGGLTINDAQRIRDGVTAGGATKTVTSATAAWCNGSSIPCPVGRTNDVGKFISCVYTSGAQSVTAGTTITIVNSTTSVSISQNDNGAGNTEGCVWYSNKADTAIRAAILAATPTNANSGDPTNKPTLGNSGTAYCPAGGYAVTVNAVAGALLTFAGTGSSIGPNFVGEGKTKCNIYILADSTDPGGPTLINLFNSSHSIIGGFSVDGLQFNFPFTHAIVSMNAVQHSRMYDVEITNISANVSNRGTLDFTNSSDIMGENIFVQGSSIGNNDFACGFFGTSSSHFKNLICSNHNQTAFFSSSGGTLRGVAGDNAPTFENATFDECGSATLDCTVFVAGYANFYGGWIGVGNSNRSAMNVDATSRVWLSGVNVGQFGSTNVVSNGITIASGGEVNATMSDIRGNGSGANGVAVTGPAGAKFNSIGGNRIRNCVSAVCTDVTAATFATQGFTGGIVPKSSETHTPNTCYVTGTFGATTAAAPMCASYADQNYQIIRIKAASTTVTACATPPVVTISDGVQTATLTLTTAKSIWDSSVDSSSGINSVFAIGNTIVASNTAGTCATPPTNFSVTMTLQSVLNP